MLSVVWVASLVRRGNWPVRGFEGAHGFGQARVMPAPPRAPPPTGGRARSIPLAPRGAHLPLAELLLDRLSLDGHAQAAVEGARRLAARGGAGARRGGAGRGF